MLVLTVGQPKSASTFMAQIARRASALVSGPQSELAAKYLGGFRQNANGFWEGSTGPLIGVAAGMDAGDVLTIKTHAPPPKKIDALAQSTGIHVFISYRHPGNAALSCFDAGAKLRAEGSDKQPAFQRLTTHRMAIDYMAAHLEKAILPWLQSGVGNLYSFEELTAEPDGILHRLEKVLNLEPEALRADPAIAKLLSGERRVYNFNKGAIGRAASEFSASDQSYLVERAGRFIDFCEGRIGRGDV